MLRGNNVPRVDPQYTTQECSKCPYCGLKLDRDTNAARNIERRALEKENSINPRDGASRSYACGDSASTYPKQDGQVGSLNQESHLRVFGVGNLREAPSIRVE
jgi:hypothetical protein